jgi:N-acetylmuramoyl-L-alanine amidase
MRGRDRSPSFDRPRVIGFSLERRRALQWMLVPAAQALMPAIGRGDAGRIASARLWPAQEYTRLILESRDPLPHQLIALKDPARIVLDLAGADLTPELAQLPARVQASDPYIAAIRFGRPAPDVLRIVVDLRGEVRPELFALQPVAEFGHRVVLDLYPLAPVDPLATLLEEIRAAEESAAAEKAAAERRAPAEPPKERAKAPPRGDTRRRIIIALDPGHGGEDPGAIGRRGTYEKHVVLAIAKRLKSILDASPNMRTVLTRDDDYYVPLAERVRRARRARADLFVSIHADAFREARARGSSVFALSENGATSAAARWLAQKENAADLIGGVNLDVRDPLLARTLLDLSQTAQISDSLKVGRHVLQEIGGHNVLHKPAVEQAGFAVLKAPDVPSILVETAFISNPDEELKLRSERHQARFAASIADGVKRYFAQNPPLARAAQATG